MFLLLYSRNHPFDCQERSTKKMKAAKVDIKSDACKGQQGVRSAGNYKANFAKLKTSERLAIPPHRLTSYKPKLWDISNEKYGTMKFLLNTLLFEEACTCVGWMIWYKWENWLMLLDMSHKWSLPFKLFPTVLTEQVRASVYCLNMVLQAS